MSFPAMNAETVSSFIGGSLGSSADPGIEIMAATYVHSFFKVPAVVDVSGMEFGVTVAAIQGTAVSTGAIASGVSTITLVMADGGATGSAPASTNHLTKADPLCAEAGFDNKGQGWTDGEVVSVVGSSTTDLDADDVLGMHVVANLTTPAGMGHIRVTTSYVFGKPGTVN